MPGSPLAGVESLACGSHSLVGCGFGVWNVDPSLPLHLLRVPRLHGGTVPAHSQLSVRGSLLRGYSCSTNSYCVDSVPSAGLWGPPGGSDSTLGPEGSVGGNLVKVGSMERGGQSRTSGNVWR